MFKVELLVDDGGEVFQDSEGEPYDRTIDFKVEERDDEWKPLNFGFSQCPSASCYRRGQIALPATRLQRRDIPFASQRAGGAV